MVEHLHLNLATRRHGCCDRALKEAWRNKGGRKVGGGEQGGGARLSRIEGKGGRTFETVDFTNLKFELRSTDGAYAAQE